MITVTKEQFHQFLEFLGNDGLGLDPTEQFAFIKKIEKILGGDFYECDENIVEGTKEQFLEIKNLMEKEYDIDSLDECYLVDKIETIFGIDIDKFIKE